VSGRIPGVSRSSLWAAWKDARSQLKNSRLRDVIDYLDYDIDPEVWFNRVLRQVSAGTYEPFVPTRFCLAKSGGFKRTLTIPHIPDLVLFGAIANFVHRKASRHQQPHVYYRRADLQGAMESAAAAARPDWATLAGEYRFNSSRSFANWMEYQQYRKHLILDKAYRHIVITDVTNFFDSVLHSEVSNAFRNYPIPSRLIGLLFYLLERLAIRADFSDSPRIGLPVDESECSRTIANLLLFPHDRRIVDLVGKSAYVRWMDDQVIGVNSRAEGLKIVSAVGASLSKLYLTANSKKTRILSLADAKIHFHLKTNGELDELQSQVDHKTKSRRALARKLKGIWRTASKHRDKGEWEKIQKRVYRIAGLTKAKFLRKQALRDVLNAPTLADRIADYMRCSGPATDYFKFAEKIFKHREQIYEDVKLTLFESLLRVETKAYWVKRVVRLAFGTITAITEANENQAFAAPACLLILRFGGKSDHRKLRRYFAEEKPNMHSGLVRSSAITYSTLGATAFALVRKSASSLLNNPLALMVRMVRRLQRFDQVPDRFKARMQLRRDSVGGRQYLDMRTYVIGRLLHLNRRKAVREWLQQWVKSNYKRQISAFDRRLLQSLAA
jgi:hypothetical protein